MKKDNITIDVAQHLANIIGSRDVAAKLASVIKKADAKSVDLDFSNVEFISRSAAHELITLKNDLKRKFLKKKDIDFINMTKDVKEMVRLVAANIAAPDKEEIKINLKTIDIDQLIQNSQAC